MKCGEYNLRKGTKVKVFSGDQRRYLGIWEYCGAEFIGHVYKNKKLVRHYVPKFKQGRKRIRGYECWWIPLSVAKKIEKEAQGENKIKSKGGLSERD